MRLTVDAAVDIDIATEWVTIEVSKIDRNSFGGATFTGTIVNDCAIDESFRQGDIVDLELYEIARWELTGDGEPKGGEFIE